MKWKKHDRRSMVGVFREMFLAGISILCVSTVIAGQPPDGAALVGNETCLSCHEEMGEAFEKTVHGVVFSAEGTKGALTCESCHGPGSAHAEESDPELIFNPAGQNQFGGRDLCVACHNTANFDNWAFSTHHTGDVNCSDCHRIHTETEMAVKKAIPELCYDCHSDIRAAFFMPSHHPVKEGKVECLDCHGIHGGGGRLTQDNSGRELCFSCHPEKEGPFVYEHAPVMEDCNICHTPHGSVANNLLSQNEPVLCLNCHAMHFHATIDGVEGAFTVPHNPSRNGVSTADGWKKGMLTKCTQCHSEIHGSDMPSQAISTSGNALTR
ncbi:MAG: GSU2203 family decaheme c-type cytochrome [candidate division Zixibacteria bacterium]|nr:GSU2203 family decaheme c-type cytochrome [candidate division Zixibacteria bacterium]